MDIISYITNEIITKEKLEKIFEKANLKYKLGGYEPGYENFWVSDKKNRAILVIDINDVNENGESITEKESLREFETGEVVLPIINGHVLDVEYSNYKVLNTFEEAIKSLYPEAYYYDDKRNKFIKL